MVAGAETELGLLSLTHLKKLTQHQQHYCFNPNPTCIINWMWNPNQTSQEDTSDAMGPTWPPRSYTCTFCRRGFQSAQALGGHMNVHRCDRAKLHQAPRPTIPTQELLANGGAFRSQYNSAKFDKKIPNYLGVTSSSINMNADAKESPSTLLSMSPFPVAKSFPSRFNNSEASPLLNTINSDNRNCDDSSMEELDLELRLGQSSSQS